ncbi:MAG: hypothetical protein J6R47_04025, partial [Acholeplasmatales bacterium]|nr:hypothetical protein [Acholeplasmatales bacterium]
TYNALLFIPKKPFYDMYSDRTERGLQLYTKGVFILDKCKDLIPEYLRFVKGLVDSADLPLNISREMLQEDRAIKKIASNVEKKILSELSRILKNDREKYEEFFKDYGINIKYGVYEDYGTKKDSLKDLVILHSLNEDKKITFSEYLDKMPDEQKSIYYVPGKDKDSILKLPQMDIIKSKGYDVFMLQDDIDEFMINVLKDYEGKTFKSIIQEDNDLISDDDQEKIESLKEEKKDLIAKIKDALPDAKEVILSKRLVDAPCCLSTDGDISFEMERVLKQQHQDIKANRIFEINPNHPLFTKIEAYFNVDEDMANKYVKMLYSQALLSEGILPDDIQEYNSLVSELMMK